MIYGLLIHGLELSVAPEGLLRGRRHHHCDIVEGHGYGLELSLRQRLGVLVLLLFEE